MSDADAEPLIINESTNLGTQFTKQRNVAAIFYLHMYIAVSQKGIINMGSSNLPPQYIKFDAV